MEQDKLQQVAELSGHSGIIRNVLWHPEQHGLVVTVEEGLIHKWDVSGTGVTHAAQAQAGELLQLWSAALHPKNPTLAATAGGNNIQVGGFAGIACDAVEMGSLPCGSMTAQGGSASPQPHRHSSQAD